MTDRIDRRSLIHLGAGALVLTPLIGCKATAEDQEKAPDPAAKKAEDEAHDVVLLNDGILLEQSAINAYLAAAGLPFIAANESVIGVAKLFLSQHEEHRDTLAKWVETLGGKPVDPSSAPTPDIPAAVTDDSLDEAARTKAVLELARRLEKQAASAYFQLVTQQLNTDYARRVAAEILPVEAQHVAIYDLVLGKAAPVSAALFSEQT
ncbi:ferritin-like domain-containing protein [Haliangium sp.]|uniref:ferritin-like domain-containing protein n=1 Tax=Haliangium sp. TaxID=2663208 RepID=UPI003D13D091